MRSLLPIFNKDFTRNMLWNSITLNFFSKVQNDTFVRQVSLTNLSYENVAQYHMCSGYYGTVFNYTDTEMYPTIGRPGPWNLTLEESSLIDLLEKSKTLKEDGYLSTDGGFFFPAPLFDTSRSESIARRKRSRRAGWFDFMQADPAVIDQGRLDRAAVSTADLVFSIEALENSNTWTFTQEVNDDNEILKNDKLIKLKSEGLGMLRENSNKSNLFFKKGTYSAIWNQSVNWRKLKSYHSNIFGKKYKLSSSNNKSSLSSRPLLHSNGWVPNSLQVPLLSLEPMNMPLPFYQSVVRWKPGGSSWWRLYRRILSYQLSWATNFPKRIITQRRVTRWVARCWRVLSFSCLRFWASTVAAVLERAGWANTPTWVINQRAIENRLWQVYPGDIIQIRGLPGSRRVLSVAPISRVEPARRALWVRWAPAIEIDELTYSVVILHWGRPANVRTSTFPYLSHRLYNWKYRT